jgi:hypothetical protein
MGMMSIFYDAGIEKQIKHREEAPALAGAVVSLPRLVLPRKQMHLAN